MTLKNQTTAIDKESLARLVRAAQQGDREAFEQLFSRYQRSVRAVAVRRLGNYAEVQELCQEVFIQAMRKIGQLRDPVCFGAWLKAITRRMAINRAMRSSPGIHTASEHFEACCIDRDTPLREVLAREERDRVRLGLNRLAELDRDTLVAFYFRGRSLAEMSDEFHSPVGTIKRRLHVARKRLAEELAALAPA